MVLAVKENGSGQVYRTDSGDIGGWAFRGILIDGSYKEIWYGRSETTPDLAFKRMSAAAKKQKPEVTDLRQWSGVWPPEEEKA